MTGITLNIDFKDIDLGMEIGRVIDEEGDVVGESTLAGAVVQKLAAEASRQYKTELAQRVREIRDEEIRLAIAPEIALALGEPFRRTNGYGEPKGEPVTMREYIVDVVQSWMNERDKYNHDKGTNIERLVRKLVEEAFKAEIAAAVKSAREAVTKQIGESFGNAVTDAVRTGLRASI
jgi:hypothetical protein